MLQKTSGGRAAARTSAEVETPEMTRLENLAQADGIGDGDNDDFGAQQPAAAG